MKKLQADLDTKLVQRDEMKEKRRLEMEGGSVRAPSSEGGEGEGSEDGGDDVNLFGDELDNRMEMG